jgi:hypothetical protein
MDGFHGALYSGTVVSLLRCAHAPWLACNRCYDSRTRCRGVAKAALVMFAGAGVSADGPSKVPEWYALNGLILRALQQRVMRYP